MPQWRFSYNAGNPIEIAEAQVIFEALRTIRTPEDLLEQRFEGDQVAIYFSRDSITPEVSRIGLTRLGVALSPPRIPPPPRAYTDVAQPPIEARTSLSMEALMRTVAEVASYMPPLRQERTMAELLLSEPVVIPPKEEATTEEGGDRFAIIRDDGG